MIILEKTSSSTSQCQCKNLNAATLWLKKEMTQFGNYQVATYNNLYYDIISHFAAGKSEF